MGAIAEQIPTGSRVADIGTDHARLPAYLVESGKAAFCVAGDRNERAIEALREKGSPRLRERISLRSGEGLSVLEDADRIQVAVLAGMGGRTIVSCLEAGNPARLGIRRLILQPQNQAALVRRWLAEAGWPLTGERQLEDRGRVYLIAVADREGPAAPAAPGFTADELLEIGPWLLHDGCPWLRRRFREQLDDATRRLAESRTVRAREAAERLRDLAERVLAYPRDRGESARSNASDI